MPLEYPVEDKSSSADGRAARRLAEPLARLRKALEKDEFELYCQPIAALPEGKIEFPDGRSPGAHARGGARAAAAGRVPAGVRALRHDAELDRWVLRNAVRQLARGSRIPRFTINVSGQTLRDAEFPAFAKAELRAAACRWTR